MNWNNIKELIKNLWANIKSNWQPIIIWGLPAAILLLISYFLWRYLISRRICIKCGCSRPSIKFWLKINSHLGICYRCIVNNVFAPPHSPQLLISEKK